MKQITGAKTQNCIYGSYTPIGFSNDGKFRYDKYISFGPEYFPSDFSNTVEVILCLNNKDLSPVKTGSPTVEMRENCHCCFAGYAHTEALCNNRQVNKIS